jgi:transposase-like protein
MGTPGRRRAEPTRERSMGPRNRQSATRPLARELRPRDVRELLRLRGNLLTGEDRALIAMYLDGGETVGRIAKLAGVTPSCIARRIRAITQRLADPTYSVCVASNSEFTSLELAIVKDHFVRGLSTERIRCNRNLSYHRVRATIRKAREYAAAAAESAQTSEQKG